MIPEEYCPECDHSLDLHVKAESGRAVCLHSESGTSSRGVIGLPYTVRCDCRDGVSERRQEAKREEEEEEARRREMVKAYLDSRGGTQRGQRKK